MCCTHIILSVTPGAGGGVARISGGIVSDAGYQHAT